jgi:cytochrome d ubiquinol oxidase subunit I
VYGLQRTVHGTSPYVSAGNIAFTSLGFMGLYLVLGLLFLYLMMRELAHGPAPHPGSPPSREVTLGHPLAEGPGPAAAPAE